MSPLPEGLVAGVEPPGWLIRGAVAAVWLYEGLWCKLLRGQPHEFEVIGAVALPGPLSGARLLMAIGAVEVGVGAWALSALAPLACAVVQTVLLVSLNTGGLLWARHLIHDPAGMVVKNFAFLVLAWVSCGLAAAA